MILKATNLFKKYREQQVLCNLQLCVEEGESIAICGRSGEGKTTLLHILGTLEKPDRGEIAIEGQIATASTAASIRNQKIGFIFQAYHLLEDFTALENISMPARIARRRKDREKARELLHLVGLIEKEKIPVKFLSGGERQRIAIARALCNEPKIILADEPTGNLDRENGRKIIELLLSLRKTLILVTHDPEIASLCTRTYFLKEGLLSLSP